MDSEIAGKMASDLVEGGYQILLSMLLIIMVLLATVGYLLRDKFA